MIIEYHRPENLTEALALLARETPATLPLGGGTALSHEHRRDIAVVDLQRLGLNTMEVKNQTLHLGATVTLQQLCDCGCLPETMRDGIRDSLVHEVSANIRQAATVAGAIAASDGRSPFITALLALDAWLIWAPGDEAQPIGEYLSSRRSSGKGCLIREIRLPLDAALSFDIVARAPMDRPIVCVAIATWASGRSRIALGGYGQSPILAMDASEPGEAIALTREAFRFADDVWASAAYRMDVAGKLVERMLMKGRVSA